MSSLPWGVLFYFILFYCNAWGAGILATRKVFRIADAFPFTKTHIHIRWNYCFPVNVSLNKKLVLTTIYRRTKERKGQVMFHFQFPRTTHWKETLTACQSWRNDRIPVHLAVSSSVYYEFSLEHWSHGTPLFTSLKCF